MKEVEYLKERIKLLEAIIELQRQLLDKRAGEYRYFTYEYPIWSSEAHISHT